MKKVSKSSARMLLVCVVLVLSFGYITNPALSASPPNVCSLSPDPPIHIGEFQGENFDVEIEVADVKNLFKFELVIAYNSSLLCVQNVRRGYLVPYDAVFDFETYEHTGQITINSSLLEAHEPINGDGSLTKLTFEVISSLSQSGSPIFFQQIKLYDQDSEEIDHVHVSALFFWQSLEPWIPDEYRYEDVYTQKGGEGLGESGGIFCYGEIVVLEAYVTYDGWPQQNLLVAFQVLNPDNETMLVFVTETNQSGYAGTSFRIPESMDSIGWWTVIASVDIACQIVWDVLIFKVDTCVGGRTVQVDVNMHQRLSVYLIVLGIAVTVLRRRRVHFQSRNQIH
jgi:hypothetical protein